MYRVPRVCMQYSDILYNSTLLLCSSATFNLKMATKMAKEIIVCAPERVRTNLRVGNYDDKTEDNYDNREHQKFVKCKQCSQCE